MWPYQILQFSHHKWKLHVRVALITRDNYNARGKCPLMWHVRPMLVLFKSDHFQVLLLPLEKQSRGGPAVIKFAPPLGIRTYHGMDQANHVLRDLFKLINVLWNIYGIYQFLEIKWCMRMGTYYCITCVCRVQTLYQKSKVPQVDNHNVLLIMSRLKITMVYLSFYQFLKITTN